MPMFRKKPVVVEAMLFTGMNAGEVGQWADPTLVPYALPEGWWIKQIVDQVEAQLVIPTLEGNHEARPGDWIIKGVKGEFYPCKPDVFAATYDPVAPPHVPETHVHGLPEAGAQIPSPTAGIKDDDE
jgi:hypothetical protein